MLSKLSSYRPSHTTIVAYLALFVALGGSSYAAVTLKKNSVRSTHIKNAQVKRADLGRNAVNSSKVGDASLLSQDFAPGQLPRGEQGERGPQGQAGRSALEPLRSGETIRGVVGADDQSPATSGDYGAFETFPVPAPQIVSGDAVDVDGNASDEVNNRCTGNAVTPSAPPGVVCIYVTTSANASNIRGAGAVPTGTGSRYGFSMYWDVSATGDTVAMATWAYTAP